MTDVFDAGFIDLPENDEDLGYQPPDFTPIKSGWYKATFDGGVEIREGVSEKGEWHALVVPCSGFVDLKTGDTKYQNRRPIEQFLFTSDSKGMLNLAQALSLVGPDGRSLVAGSRDEFVEQCNSQGGTEVKIYIMTAPRRKKIEGTWETQLKDDGTPWIDSNIKSIEPLD